MGAAVHQGADGAPIECTFYEDAFPVAGGLSGLRLLRPLTDRAHVSNATTAIFATTPGPTLLVSLPQGIDQHLLELPGRVRVDMLVDGFMADPLTGVVWMFHAQPPGNLLW